ncbi:hypothetical protein [Moraxella cuniculi]|nr:hypothetical protein [Moraxella cuniculi]
MLSKYNYLMSQELKITALCLCIQQLIVASSTYFIARLAAGVGQGEISMLYAVLFVISLVVVYVPAYFCMVYLERAKYTAWLGYIKRFEDKFLGRVSFILMTQPSRQVWRCLAKRAKLPSTVR